MNFIYGFIVGIGLVLFLQRIIAFYKVRKIAQKEEAQRVVEKFGSALQIFNLSKKEFFNHEGGKFLGYSHSLLDELTTNAYCVYVDIHGIDVGKKHIYLKLRNETYNVNVSEIVDSDMASGYDGRLFGGLVFRHDIEDLKIGTNVKVSLFEVKKNVFEARTIS